MNINPSFVFVLALLDLPQRWLCHCEWGAVVCVCYLTRVPGSLLSMFCWLFVSVCGTPVTSLLLIHSHKSEENFPTTLQVCEIYLELSLDTPFLLRGQWGEPLCHGGGRKLEIWSFRSVLLLPWKSLWGSSIIIQASIREVTAAAGKSCYFSSSYIRW